MKKFSLLLPILLIPVMTGCSNNDKILQITYGSMVNEEAVQLTSDEFDTKISNGENMLLAIYPKDSSCSCWKYFKQVIDQVAKEEHLVIYKYYSQDVNSSYYMKNSTSYIARNDAPTFYVASKDYVRTYNYNGANTFFKDANAFKDELYRRIKLPKLMLVNETYIDNVIATENSALLYCLRDSCEDCSFITPHSLLPYIDSKQPNKYIYCLDFDPFRSDSEVYQTKKDKYLLSTTNNPTLGFNKGVFPTLQYYESGELKDMMVYVNDGILEEKEGKYYPVNSYYNESRNQYHHYLDNVEVKDLTKVAIEEKDTYLVGDSIRLWNNEAASKYYDPILVSFLDTYLR